MKEEDVSRGGIGLTSEENVILEKKTSSSQTQEPTEDNLDDLDDLLDDFSTTDLNRAKDNHLLPRPDGIQENHNPRFSDLDATDFSKQLQEQMAALMGEVDETPQMKQEIEAMMQELGTVADPGEAGGQNNDARASGPSSTEKPFQAKIRKTVERMQVSGEQANMAGASDDPDNIIAQLLQEMQGGGGFEGGENEEEFSNMLTGMMEQLTNRDILFEPMKELHEKFPEWMTNNRESTDKHDLKRYEDQQRLVGEIIGKFNEKGYSDSNSTDREFIVERMQQMQAAGSPPADLVGDMNAAQETLEDFDAGCAQQ